jgi:hypothetical protein
MECFAGKLIRSNSAVVASAYGQAETYWALNFDSLVRGPAFPPPPPFPTPSMAPRIPCTRTRHHPTPPPFRPFARAHVRMPACPPHAPVCVLRSPRGPQTSAHVALFALMTVNDWPIIMEGCVAATNTGARLFFISFYGVTVILVLNVLVRGRRAGVVPLAAWEHLHSGLVPCAVTKVVRPLVCDCAREGRPGFCGWLTSCPPTPPPHTPHTQPTRARPVCQVAFYVESYSLMRLKVATERVITHRQSLNLLCSRKERQAQAKAPPPPADAGDWWVPLGCGVWGAKCGVRSVVCVGSVGCGVGCGVCGYWVGCVGWGVCGCGYWVGCMGWGVWFGVCVGVDGGVGWCVCVREARGVVGVAGVWV